MYAQSQTEELQQDVINQGDKGTFDVALRGHQVDIEKRWHPLRVHG
jgi:hypothetical protein